MNELAELSVGPMIMMVSITLLLRLWKGSLSMLKLGRFTAAALVLTVGALLLWDQIKGRNDISLLGQWWPIIFILLGLETIIFSLKFKGVQKRLRLDVTGGMIAIVITLTAYGVTQYADLPFRWLDQFNVDLNGPAEFGEEKGFQYDKAVIKVPLDEEASLIRIVNPNGQVTVRSGEVQEIELLTTVWVDVTDQSEADAIAEQTTVKIDPGTELTVEAKGQAYGANGSRKPRMNMIVTVPMSLSDQLQVEELPVETALPEETESAIDVTDDLAAVEQEMESSTEIEDLQVIETDAPGALETDLNEEPEQTPDIAKEQKPLLKLKVESGNGAVDIRELTLSGGLDIRSNSGIVTVSNIIGAVYVKGIAGEIAVNGVTGDSTLEIKNGSIMAAAIQGKLFANTLNGSLDLKDIEGNVEAETKNGKFK